MDVEVMDEIVGFTTDLRKPIQLRHGGYIENNDRYRIKKVRPSKNRKHKDGVRISKDEYENLSIYQRISDFYLPDAEKMRQFEQKKKNEKQHQKDNKDSQQQMSFASSTGSNKKRKPLPEESSPASSIESKRKKTGRQTNETSTGKQSKRTK